MKNNLKITIGIPTCYGGDSLVKTVQSLRKTKISNIEILIEADRTPWSKKVKNQVSNLKAKAHWNNVEGSQCKKLNQIIKKASGDIFVFTQDDILFDENALEGIKKEFENDPKLTMLGARVVPLKPETLFESAMVTMSRIAYNIASKWNKGDNYLLASARCLAFRTKHLKKFRLPDTLVNTDVFMYFENKHLKGKFKSSKKAKVFIRSPRNLKDQLGPSSRYQYCQKEVSRYFQKDISSFFQIPRITVLTELVKELLRHPFNFITYLLIFIYTRIKRQSIQKALRTSWDVDLSTKIDSIA